MYTQSKHIFSLDLSLLDVLREADRIAIEEQAAKSALNFKKALDTSTSLKQNRSMKNTTFALAVLTAIGDVRQRPTFSAHDVTKRVRETINNSGDVNLIDRQREDVNGQDTYRVEHEDVKEIFAILLENKIITNLEKRHNGVYIEYRNTPDTQCARPLTPIASVSVTPPQCINVPAQSAALLDKLKAYLNTRAHMFTSMKRIQSRFDAERGRTCVNYAEMVENLGLSINKSCAPNSPSCWCVFVPANLS